MSVADDCCLRFWRGLISSLILVPGVANLRNDVADYGVEPHLNGACRSRCHCSKVLAIVRPRAPRKITAAFRSFGGTLCKSPIDRACDHSVMTSAVPDVTRRRRPIGIHEDPDGAATVPGAETRLSPPPLGLQVVRAMTCSSASASRIPAS